MSRWQLRQSVGRAIAQMQTYVMKSLHIIELLPQRITRSWSNRRVHFLCLFAVGLILSTAITACGNASASNDIKLRLVSFSVTKAAHDQIIPKFIQKWNFTSSLKKSLAFISLILTSYSLTACSSQGSQQQVSIDGTADSIYGANLWWRQSPWQC